MNNSLVVLLLCLISVCAQYNPAISRELVIYSSSVYAPQVALKNWNCKLCNLYELIDRQYFDVKSHNLFGMVGYSIKLKAIVVAFRGTQPTSLKNMKTDLKVSDVNYINCKGCKVHKGFYQASNLLKPLMLKNLDILIKRYPDSLIYLTGHSLGGAVSTLLSAELSLNKTLKLAPVYTFGEPRVGNKKFADWFNSIITEYRVIHYRDIIPSYPHRKSPLFSVSNFFKRFKSNKKMNIAVKHYMSLSHQTLFDFEYFHEGIEIWYSLGMKQYRICKSQDPQCYNSLKTYSWLEHRKKYYISMPGNGTAVTHFQAYHFSSF